MGKACLHNSSLSKLEDANSLLLADKLLANQEWPKVNYQPVLGAGWRCVMLNQKDVAAGQPLDDIRGKKRMTKDVEPLMHKMRKNLKTVKGKKGA